MPNVRYVGFRATTVWVLTLLLTGLAWSQPMSTVTGVKVSQKGQMLNVEVGASGRVQHRSKVLTSPQKFIVIDVFPAKLKDGVPASTDVNQGLVEKVRVKQYAENTVRIYVDVISPPEFKVITAPDAKGLTVAINANKMASGETKSAPAPVAETAPVKKPATVAQEPTQRAQPRVKPATNRVRAVAPARSMAYDGEAKAPVSALRARKAPRRPKAPPQKLVTLDFVNADLVYVLKVLAKEMNRNIYVGPTVAGSVTVTLKNVPVEGAMALILQMQENEYDYKLLDYNTIVVAAPEKLSEVADDVFDPGNVKDREVPEDAIRMEYLLEEAPSAKVVDFLKEEYPRVKFTPHPTMNGFYANGSKEDLLQIKRELANLDRVPEPPPPPLREFLPVKYGDISEIRGLLGTLVPDVQYNVDVRQSLLIVEGSPGAIDQVRELLAELDRPLDQVMIDLKVVDISDNGTKNLGVTWGSNQSAFSLATSFSEQAVGQQVVRTPTGPVLDPVAAIASPQTVPIAIGSFARSALAIDATISFLVTQNEAKILASPRVASISGKPSLIHIGDKYPIVYFDPRAGQFQVQYVDIGIKLDVTSNVKADGYVLIEVRPEVSTLLELINNQYPRTAVRIIETNMRVKDGDTIIMGGLIREEDIQNVSKIPLLGDLPILGSLFRTVNVTKNRNEVVLMMTPHIMR
jgi:type II secretory pathway component GspD/PulD (secretin)